MTDPFGLAQQLEALAEIPRDIVPTKPTAADYLALDGMTGQNVTVQTPGSPVEDVDGNLIAMTPSKSESAYLAPAVITADELARVGLTADDVPNLKVVNINERNNPHE